MHVVERVDRVDDGLDVTLQVESEELAEQVGHEATRVEHLREQKAVQVKATQRAIFFVELERRDFVDVPPVLGQLKVVLALAFYISRCSYFEWLQINKSRILFLFFKEKKIDFMI